MKKMAICTFPTALTMAILLAFSLLFASVANAGVAAFKKVHGVVDVFPAGAKKAQAVALGNTVNVGDIVRTGRRSRAQLKFTDGSVLNIGSLTKIEIGEFAYSAENKVRKSSIRNLRGQVRAAVSKAETTDSYFRIETPSAVAAVRGTNYSVQVFSPTDTLVATFEGTVAVYNKNDPQQHHVVFVQAHEFTRVRGALPPNKPAKTPKAFEAKVQKSTKQGAAAASGDSSANSNGGSSASAAPVAAPVQAGPSGGAPTTPTGSAPSTGTTSPAGGVAVPPVTPPLVKSTPAAANANAKVVIQF